MTLKGLKRKARAALIGTAVPLLAQLVALLGWSGAQRFGAALGSLGWRFARRERDRALFHLERAFPELTEIERSARGKACFRHLGAMGGETLLLLARGKRGLGEQLRIEGAEYLQEAISGPRPVVLLMGHCGNWELVGAALGRLGVDTWAIVREMQAPAIEDLVAAFRARLGGIRSIPRGSTTASRALLTILRQPHSALALLADQDFDAEGVMVPFFGHPAHTPLGPARLALRRGCLVVPIFDHRNPDGSHTVEAFPPLELPADEHQATAVMTKAIEAQIRRFPEQWVWMHRRWRRTALARDGAAADDGGVSAGS